MALGIVAGTTGTAHCAGRLKKITAPGRHPHTAQLGRTEKALGIPKGLLSAISKVESGRMNQDKTAIAPWPWALNVGGAGRFFGSKEEAVAAADALIKKGVRNFDVGLMQVNLFHHPDAFTSIESAFDPAHNIHYAAQFLVDLKKRLGSWEKAIAHYHSSNPTHHIPYRKKVMNIWREEQKNGPFPLRWEEAAFDRSHNTFQGRMISGLNPSARPMEWRKKSAGYNADYLSVFRHKIKHQGAIPIHRGNIKTRLPAPSWRQISALNIGKSIPAIRVIRPPTGR